MASGVIGAVLCAVVVGVVVVVGECAYIVDVAYGMTVVVVGCICVVVPVCVDVAVSVYDDVGSVCCVDYVDVAAVAAVVNVETVVDVGVTMYVDGVYGVVGDADDTLHIIRGVVVECDILVWWYWLCCRL